MNALRLATLCFFLAGCPCPPPAADGGVHRDLKPDNLPDLSERVRCGTDGGDCPVGTTCIGGYCETP